MAEHSTCREFLRAFSDRRCVVKPPICPRCSDERMRWLDTRPQDLFRQFAFITQANAAYGFTPKGVADHRRMRWERWRELVNWQMQAIADACRTAGHADSDVAPGVPKVVQLDLLTSLGVVAA